MGRKPQVTQLTLMIKPATAKIPVSFIVHLLDNCDLLLVVVRRELDPQLAQVNVELLL